jgi:hypothetical protein
MLHLSSKNKGALVSVWSRFDETFCVCKFMQKNGERENSGIDFFRKLGILRRNFAFVQDPVRYNGFKWPHS